MSPIVTSGPCSDTNSLCIVEYGSSLGNNVTKVKVTPVEGCLETPLEYLNSLRSGITEDVFCALTDLQSGGFLTDQCIFDVLLQTKRHNKMDKQIKDSLLRTAIMFIGLNQLHLKTNTLKALMIRLWEIEGNFQIIFEEILKPFNGEVEDFYPRLRYFLRHSGHLNFLHSGKNVSLLNAPLAFGESPVMAACKNKRPGAISLLLRHGANPVSDWLSYTHALQVVIFSPTKRWISSFEIENTELCLNYILRMTSSLQLSEFTAMEKRGYYAVYEQWKELLEKFKAFGPCSLQKLCKLRIRECLKNEPSIPMATTQLPLPRTLREYIDLRREL